MRIFAFLIAGLLVPAGVLAQERQDERRAALEAQVYQRFLDRASQQLGLDGAQRGRLDQVLQATAIQRRGLARKGGELRMELVRALRDPATTEAEFNRLLVELDSLRDREFEVWREEQRALAGVLNPRQRAAFIGLRGRFNERLLELRQRRRQDGQRGQPNDFDWRR